MSEENKVEETNPLSYSSATLLKNCPQKYYYYKVAQVPKDPDYEQNEEAFNVGKAFHYVMEMNGHTEDDLDGWLDKACKAYDVEDKKAMLNAMLLRYLQAHTKSGLEVVFSEFEIKTDDFIGYVDAIMKDPATGLWFIVDLKTAARYSEVTTARLPYDTQLNLYAYFAPKMAEYFELDPKRFAGARYRVTTKSDLKKKVTESYADHVRRIAKNVKSYDIVIPAELMKPDEFMQEHEDLKFEADCFRKGLQEPKRNRSYCDSYFRPCEYWSQCHGCTYSESQGLLKMITSNNV